MGTPIEDCWEMGRLLGIKTAANEFVAYSELMELQKSGALHERFGPLMMNHAPSSMDSKPQTPNPKPQTPNPKPQTPNPKP